MNNMNKYTNERIRLIKTERAAISKHGYIKS